MREFLSLSYGQKRLALLARALVQRPDWLLLDEFYNGLDAVYRRRIDAVLDAARARDQAWIATAHRAADVPRGTRRMLVLQEGRVRAVKPIRASDLKGLAARAGDLKPGRRRAAAALGPVLVRLTDVDLYVEYRAVLRGLNWQLRRGQHWAVYGANGAGKSSFLKLLYGDLSPAHPGGASSQPGGAWSERGGAWSERGGARRIERAGLPVSAPISEWKRRVGYVSPELQSDYAVNVSVADLVASGRHASIGLVDAPTASDRRAAARWLRFFGLSSVAKRRPRELSYGQLRRALIARALAGNARILLLDEPLTGLDPRQRALMKRLLERLMKTLTVVIAVHHPEDLPRGMTHGLRLHNRRAFEIDSYSAT
jgi:molybdate transport system ATP-binding protein